MVVIRKYDFFFLVLRVNLILSPPTLLWNWISPALPNRNCGLFYYSANLSGSVSSSLRRNMTMFRTLRMIRCRKNPNPKPVEETVKPATSHWRAFYFGHHTDATSAPYYWCHAVVAWKISSGQGCISVAGGRQEYQHQIQ